MPRKTNTNAHTRTPSNTGRQSLNPRLITFALLFLVSGAAGLIYEIVWERLLELYFGVTMLAITLIVAAYMGGLGLGSLLGGRIAARLKSRLLVYGLVELGIAAFGVFSPRIITWVGQITAGSPYPLVFILSFALLLVPTLLMGMTLPLLSQAFIDRVEVSGQIVGILYGINTLGAAFGSLLTGYVIIGEVGLDGAAIIAASLNAAVGLSAILLNHLRTSILPKAESKSQPDVKADRIQWGYRTILLASFLVGFIGLGYEMLWMRALNIINKNTVYSFPSVLFVFLTGLAIGSYWWGRKADRTTDPAGLFWKLEIGVGVAASLSFLILWKVIDLPAVNFWIQDNFQHFQRPTPVVGIVNGHYALLKDILFSGLFEYLLPIVFMVFPASLIMGGGLPVLDRIAITSSELAGRRVGDVHLLNILGSVTGTLAISFLFLPTLGSENTLKVLAFLSLIFPCIYLFCRRKAGIIRRNEVYSATAAMVVTALLIAILPSRGQFYRAIFEAATGGQAILHESGDSLLALTFNDKSEPTTLWIGGEINSRFPSDGGYERMALTCAGASLPERILIIGLGGGNTAFFLESLPGVKEIVIVELMKDLGTFLDKNLPTVSVVLNDPRVQYLIDDGRRYLYAHPNEKFDLITIDPLRRYTTGHNNLYSVEAMGLYLSHLSEGGVLCEWQDDYHILPMTTATVFPLVDDFTDYVIAGNQPLYYDLAYMQVAVQNYLQSLGEFIDPQTIKLTAFTPMRSLAGFQRDQEQIREEERNSPTLVDLRPMLEYYYFHGPINSEIARLEITRQVFIQRIKGCNDACRTEINKK